MCLTSEFIYVLTHAYKKDDKTIKQYNINLKEFKSYIFNNKDIAIEDIKNIYADDILIKWLRIKEEQGMSASSLNQRISTVRSFYKWLISRGMLSLDISQSIPLFKNTTRVQKEILTLEESLKLIEVAAQESEENENYNTLRIKLITELFLGCGIRIEEMSNLNTECFNLKEKKLYLTETKYNKFRKASIPDEVLYTYTRYMVYRNDLNKDLSEDMHNVVFISKKKNRLSTDQIRRDFYKLIDLCNFDKKITPHSLRHSFGTLMLNSGEVSLEDLSKEMGHSNINTTMNWYIRQSDKNISSANPIFKDRNSKNKDNVIEVKFA